MGFPRKRGVYIRKKIAAVIFEGGSPRHWVTKSMAAVRAAVVLDTIAKLRQLPSVSMVILSTNYPRLAEEAALRGAEIHRTEGAFHLGRALQEIIRQREPDAVMCLGGAAAPFFTIEEFRALAESLEISDSVVLANNPQSADLVAFTPAKALFGILPPSDDNTLANALCEQGLLPRVLLPHSLGVHFDLDTPTDALLMALSPRTGQEVRASLDKLKWPTTTLKQALERLTRNHCELCLIGRVSPAVMAQVNSRSFVRLRVHSEERGMKALGRIERGEVVSFLGHLLEAVGIEAFFAYLAKTADVCFFDTRVLFAHLKLQLAESERFLSDLGLYEEITHPWLREFTKAAVNSPIPVILGGHSLVSGGIWVALDILELVREKNVDNFTLSTRDEY